MADLPLSPVTTVYSLRTLITNPAQDYEISSPVSPLLTNFSQTLNPNYACGDGDLPVRATTPLLLLKTLFQECFSEFAETRYWPYFAATILACTAFSVVSVAAPLAITPS